MDWLRSPSILRASFSALSDFLSKLSISSRIEITVGSSSPPYLSLPRLPRKSWVLVSALSTLLMPASAVLMTLVIRSPLPDSEAVKVSKFSSVSFTAVSLSVIALSTLRSARRIFSCRPSVPSESAVSSGMPSAPLSRRRRAVGAAGERDRRNPRQTLEFEADLGVPAHRRGAVDHGQRHDAARMVELQRHHLADPDAGEIDAAAPAQAGGGTLEDHAERHLLPDAGDLAIGQERAERPGNQGQGQGADHQVAGARFHLARTIADLPPQVTGLRL